VIYVMEWLGTKLNFSGRCNEWYWTEPYRIPGSIIVGWKSDCFRDGLSEHFYILALGITNQKVDFQPLISPVKIGEKIFLNIYPSFDYLYAFVTKVDTVDFLLYVSE
jgi:hypothetical protein